MAEETRGQSPGTTTRGNEPIAQMAQTPLERAQQVSLQESGKTVIGLGPTTDTRAADPSFRNRVWEAYKKSLPQYEVKPGEVPPDIAKRFDDLTAQERAAQKVMVEAQKTKANYIQEAAAANALDYERRQILEEHKNLSIGPDGKLVAEPIYTKVADGKPMSAEEKADYDAARYYYQQNVVSRPITGDEYINWLMTGQAGQKNPIVPTDLVIPTESEVKTLYGGKYTGATQPDRPVNPSAPLPMMSFVEFEKKLREAGVRGDVSGQYTAFLASNHPEEFTKSYKALSGAGVINPDGTVNVQLALDKGLDADLRNVGLTDTTVSNIRNAIKAQQLDQSRADEAQAEFRKNNVVIGDKFLSNEDWNVIPEKYQSIALKSGYDAMQAAMDADRVAFNRENITIGNQSMPLEQWNKLRPEDQSIALRQGFTAMTTEMSNRYETALAALKPYQTKDGYKVGEYLRMGGSEATLRDVGFTDKDIQESKQENVKPVSADIFIARYFADRGWQPINYATATDKEIEQNDLKLRIASDEYQRQFGQEAILTSGVAKGLNLLGFSAARAIAPGEAPPTTMELIQTASMGALWTAPLLGVFGRVGAGIGTGVQYAATAGLTADTISRWNDMTPLDKTLSLGMDLLIAASVYRGIGIKLPKDLKPEAIIKRLGNDLYESRIASMSTAMERVAMERALNDISRGIAQGKPELVSKGGKLFTKWGDTLTELPDVAQRIIKEGGNNLTANAKDYATLVQQTRPIQQTDLPITGGLKRGESVRAFNDRVLNEALNRTYAKYQQVSELSLREHLTDSIKSRLDKIDKLLNKYRADSEVQAKLRALENKPLTEEHIADLRDTLDKFIRSTEPMGDRQIKNLLDNAQAKGMWNEATRLKVVQWQQKHRIDLNNTKAGILRRIEALKGKEVNPERMAEIRAEMDMLTRQMRQPLTPEQIKDLMSTLNVHEWTPVERARIIRWQEKNKVGINNIKAMVESNIRALEGRKLDADYVRLVKREIEQFLRMNPVNMSIDELGQLLGKKGVPHTWTLADRLKVFQWQRKHRIDLNNTKSRVMREIEGLKGKEITPAQMDNLRASLDMFYKKTDILPETQLNELMDRLGVAHEFSPKEKAKFLKWLNKTPQAQFQRGTRLQALRKKLERMTLEDWKKEVKVTRKKTDLERALDEAEQIIKEGGKPLTPEDEAALREIDEALKGLDKETKPPDERGGGTAVKERTKPETKTAEVKPKEKVEETPRTKAGVKTEERKGTQAGKKSEVKEGEKADTGSQTGESSRAYPRTGSFDESAPAIGTPINAPTGKPADFIKPSTIAATGISAQENPLIAPNISPTPSSAPAPGESPAPAPNPIERTESVSPSPSENPKPEPQPEPQPQPEPSPEPTPTPNPEPTPLPTPTPIFGTPRTPSPGETGIPPIKLGGMARQSGQSQPIEEGSIAWASGARKGTRGQMVAQWYYIPPPYDMAKPISLDAPPLGAVNTDSKSPYDTIQIIGRSRAVVPHRISIDLGWSDIAILDGNKIEFQSGGEVTDVGQTLASPTVGMSVNNLGEGRVVNRAKMAKKHTRRKQSWLDNLTSLKGMKY